VTNQVYADFEKKEDVKMVGGDILKYWSKCIVKLEKTETARKAVLMKHRSLPENLSFYFLITEKDFQEIPEPKQKRKIDLF
jgi:DNA repair protein RadB